MTELELKYGLRNVADKRQELAVRTFFQIVRLEIWCAAVWRELTGRAQTSGR